MSRRSISVSSMAAVVVFGFCGCAQEGIPILGLDDNGRYIERYASDGELRNELMGVSTQVASSTFKALQSATQDQSGTLRTVVVGLGFNFSGGLGDFVTLGVSPRVRFIFSNQKNPFLP